MERGTFDRPVYRLAHETFRDLPLIPEFEETNQDADASPEDVDRRAVAEFESMLLDRTRELKALLGRWYALWETEVEGRLVFNSEELTFVAMHSRKRVMITNPQASRENPIGGYAWRAECRFIDGDALLGVYASTVEENLAKGALQMRIHPHGKFIDGQWVGQGYDHEFQRGHVVMCREKAQLVPRMEKLLGHSIDFQFHPGDDSERES